MVAEKKKPFEIEVPVLNQSVEALASSQDSLIGRVIKLDLTRIVRGKNLDANIIIKKEGSTLTGKLVSLKLLPGYIKRMMRKEVSWVEDSFTCPSKETNMLFKPFMLTRKKVHRAVRKAIRDKTKEIILEFAKNHDNDSIFSSIISGQLQKEISVNAKKIYPLAFCEIRIAKIK